VGGGGPALGSGRKAHHLARHRRRRRRSRALSSPRGTRRSRLSLPDGGHSPRGVGAGRSRPTSRGKPRNPRGHCRGNGAAAARDCVFVSSAGAESQGASTAPPGNRRHRGGDTRPPPIRRRRPPRRFAPSSRATRDVEPRSRPRPRTATRLDRAERARLGSETVGRRARPVREFPRGLDDDGSPLSPPSMVDGEGRLRWKSMRCAPIRCAIEGVFLP